MQKEKCYDKSDKDDAFKTVSSQILEKLKKLRRDKAPPAFRALKRRKLSKF